ncbi:MAG: LamG domain-containing protein, partial [Pricia sp.]|nr:LamG domain-containing protein [Pricia sp.]
MKRIKSILTCLTAIILVMACDQGIDSITEVAPGTDASAPVVTINSPAPGSTIKVLESTTSLTVDFEVTDDIEIATIQVTLDGRTIGSYTGGFLDYRRVIVDDLIYNGLTDGSHELSVTATDMEGKATTSTVNFSKEPPYIPKYDGEIFYLPFDGNYTDLISFQTATVEGDPIFSEESLNGPSAYSGAAESYLTFPTDGLKNANFSAIFWVNINAVPDRAGIMVMSPPLIDGTNNDLTKGFRFFRENAGGMQRFKLNVGSGDSGHWFDGGEAADVDPSIDQWVNMAFTISGSEAIVYIDGQVVSQGAFPGLDWTDCDVLSIMSGAPNFTQWNHWSDQSLLDELRIFDRVLTQQDIQQIMGDDSGEFVSSYSPTFDGEMFYMPFDGDYNELFRDMEATVVGSPSFAGESAEGDNAYAGAADSYLTFPANETGPITTDEFSATFWYKVNADPDRAGILVLSPPLIDGTNNDLTKGFRFFRENAGGMQRFKLNVGSGDAGNWFDGGEAADLPTDADWTHMAFTISQNEATVYINGEIVSQGSLP